MTSEVSVSSTERHTALLAFTCNFILLGSYYILRPVRDTVATIIGVGKLQELFTATFIGTLLASALYAALASKIRLTRLLPAVFWFWLMNVMAFSLLFRIVPDSRALAASYYVWFSVANLFMVSVFWSLMVDVFTARQATYWFARIAAGGALGAIVGPLVTRAMVKVLGLSGLMILAACGFCVVIVLVHLLMRQKERLRGMHCAQSSSLNQTLSGSPLQGFGELLKSPYFLSQAGFILLMTWVNTVAYFCQTDLISRTYHGIAERTQALADIDLIVNVCTAGILLLGAGRFMRRFGVTAGLVLNPVLMLIAFIATAASPTLLMMQLLQIVRRVAQYAIARPSREVCFTVVEQNSRYKTKNTIDTVVYRFGDVSSAWLQSGLMSFGYGLEGALLFGAAASAAWGIEAFGLGRRYAQARDNLNASTARETSRQGLSSLVPADLSAHPRHDRAQPNRWP